MDVNVHICRHAHTHTHRYNFRNCQELFLNVTIIFATLAIAVLPNKMTTAKTYSTAAAEGDRADKRHNTGDLVTAE